MTNPFDVLAGVAYPVVEGLAHVLAGPFGGAAAAVAVVLGTVLVRVGLLPVGYWAHRGERRRNALMARVAEVRERHGGNSTRRDAELAELYREQGGGMLLGCLPMLVQLPLFAGLYRVFTAGRIGGHANALLHQRLFGLPLGAHLLRATGGQLVVFGVLLALLAAVGFASSRLLRPAGPAPSGAAGLVTRVMPYASLVSAAALPFAAGLYLVTTTACTLAQTLALRHWAG
jgi:YidC/Oxa1 family membrane protein insertase